MENFKHIQKDILYYTKHARVHQPAPTVTQSQSYFSYLNYLDYFEVKF